jgi:hypothetical protein
MKATLTEHEGCYSIELTPESQVEAVSLIRLGMNRTQEVRSANTHAHQDGTVTSYVTFGKSKRADSMIPRRK